MEQTKVQKINVFKKYLGAVPLFALIFALSIVVAETTANASGT